MKVLLVSVMLLCTVAGLARSHEGWVIHVDGELAFPTSPAEFKDNWNSMGFGGGADVGALLTQNLMVTAGANYTSIGFDTDKYLAGLSPNQVALPPGSEATAADGGGISILYASLEVRMLLMDESARVRPYGIVGGGYYHIKVSDLTVDWSTPSGPFSMELEGTSETAFGFDVGLGGSAGINESTSAFVEGRYVSGLTEDESTAHMSVRGGVMFLFGQN